MIACYANGEICHRCELQLDHYHVYTDGSEDLYRSVRSSHTSQRYAAAPGYRVVKVYAADLQDVPDF